MTKLEKLIAGLDEVTATKLSIKFGAALHLQNRDEAQYQDLLIAEAKARNLLCQIDNLSNDIKFNLSANLEEARVENDSKRVNRIKNIIASHQERCNEYARLAQDILATHVQYAQSIGYQLTK